MRDDGKQGYLTSLRAAGRRASTWMYDWLQEHGLTRPELEALMDRTHKWADVAVALVLGLAVALLAYKLTPLYGPSIATVFLCFPIAR